MPDGPAIKMGRHFSYKQTQMGSLHDDRDPQRSSPFESPRLDAASASGRLSQFPSVERRRTPCCGICGVGFRSGRHRRLRPLLAAPCDERFTVRRSSKSGFVRHWLVRLHEMDRESHETQLPADAGCARPVLTPVFRKQRGVRQREPRPVSSVVRDTYLHSTDIPYELPCEREMRLPFAHRDHAARVAFQLIAPAGSQFAADRQKPARDTLAVRHGILQVLNRRRVAARKSDRASVLSTPLQRRHGTLHRAKVTFDVKAHVSPCAS